MSTDQAAGVAAVDRYRAAIHRIESNPADFSEAEMTAILKRVAGGNVITANVASYLDLQKRGFRYDGDTAVASTKVSKPSKASFGTEVVVTRCIDQRALRVIDKAGAEVSSEKLGYTVPDFNLRQYTAIRPLGFDGYVQDFAKSVGARHLMGLPNGIWQRELLEAIADGKTRISVFAKGFDDLEEMIKRGEWLDAGNKWARRAGRNPSATDWEMFKLSQAGWPRVTIFRADGTIDPFLPLIK